MARPRVVGASGSGTSTLGRALAERLDCRHVDADDRFWLPTDPPFTTRRPRGDRQALLLRRLPAAEPWVFSGSALTWAAPLEAFYDLIVFLRLDPAMRMARLRRREELRYGERLKPGGDMAAASDAFLAWAEAYDVAGPEQRSLIGHETWLASQAAPVLRLDSSALPQDLVRAVEARLRGID
jgi:adenylate kinase family enzyme